MSSGIRFDGNRAVLPNGWKYEALENQQVIDIDGNGVRSAGDLYYDTASQSWAIYSPAGTGQIQSPEQARAMLESAYHLCTLSNWDRASQEAYLAVAQQVAAYFGPDSAEGRELAEHAANILADVNELRAQEGLAPLSAAAPVAGADAAGEVEPLRPIAIPEEPGPARMTAVLYNATLYAMGQMQPPIPPELQPVVMGLVMSQAAAQLADGGAPLDLAVLEAAGVSPLSEVPAEILQDPEQLLALSNNLARLEVYLATANTRDPNAWLLGQGQTGASASDFRNAVVGPLHDVVLGVFLNLPLDGNLSGS